jgi:hypothetical protein
MRFLCPCGKKELNIPDDKVPNAPRFALKCPLCQKRMVVDLSGAAPRAFFPEEAKAPGATAPSEPAAPAAPPAKAAAMPAALPAVEPDAFPPGAKVAFVRLDDPAWRTAAETFLREKGFHSSEASEPLVGVAKLRLNHYDVIFLADEPGAAPLLEEISSWPGLRRRGVNLVLVGREGKSLQPDVAFQKAANAYLCTDDAARAGELFGEALTAYEIHYRPVRMAQEQG